jgi:hypothetical protein
MSKSRWYQQSLVVTKQGGDTLLTKGVPNIHIRAGLLTKRGPRVNSPQIGEPPRKRPGTGALSDKCALFVIMFALSDKCALFVIMFALSDNVCFEWYVLCL